MANNFISNSPQKTLSGRLNNIIKFSTELRWLVGFFYFSGWNEVYKSLKENPESRIRLLVGLQVGPFSQNIIEHDIQNMDLSRDDYFSDFMKSLGFAINNKQQDRKEFYEQVRFFLNMIINERLIIRKTKEPNHAKLYLFEMNEEERSKHNFDGYLITGSSNLTRSGLKGQQEFNVEIKDYGYKDAVDYFDQLWDDSIPISEIEGQKKRLIEFVEHQSQAAEVKPFEAYAFVLKTYLDLQSQKKLKPQVEELLEKNGFKKFSYQIDAVNQALSILEENNGVVIADVVGLGKSVIASLIARNLDTKGIIVCPPGLIGNHKDKTGWWGYVRNFDLKGWHVYSRGQIEDLKENLDDSDIETVIIDEAHSFRNQDTAAYEGLAQICRGKQVILLTATPFNNSPADIFSLLKLFMIPGRSAITLEDNLDGIFRGYDYTFKQLGYILKNYNSTKLENREKAEKKYLKYVDDKLPIHPNLVRAVSSELAETIKNVISPVVIRRNRIDLKKDHLYKKEIKELSTVNPPEELFYYLTQSQSEFYNQIIREYFAEEGKFTGAIYRPVNYERVKNDDSRNEEENRAYQRQRNLFDFMRRLLVKRFESSFGAFEKTIERFITVHEVVLKFIEKTKGKYILDRNLIEKIYEDDEDQILKVLDDFEKELLSRRTPKDTTVYDVNKFEKKDEFLEHIHSDLALFRQIKEKIKEEKLVENDPKRKGICERVAQSLKDDPDRKIILFTEYVDTVHHLENYFKEALGDGVLVCDGHLTKKLAGTLERNFNAQYTGKQLDNYQVLITSDKLSEGVNLNRAGTIINYDIPWNPTRVIQRVGRINRIGTKVFDELNIFNFFPSETGAEYVKSREIAAQKMFMIHNALGEDTQIFSSDEEPTASGLYQKINDNPEDDEEVNFITYIRNRYEDIKIKHPGVIERIEKLPHRVKSSKKFNAYNVNVLRKKGLSLFPHQSSNEENAQVKYLNFNDFLEFVECEPQTKRLPLSEDFWPIYEKIKVYKEKINKGFNPISTEKKAFDNLKVARNIIPVSEEENIAFIETLIRDIREYRTMSTYTLRRLTFKKLTPNSSKKDWDKFFKELNFIKNRFGKDYLDKLLNKIENKEDEIIIAIENRI